MSEKLNHVWVVEMWNDQVDRWEPTVGVALSRDVARVEVRQWRDDNPDDEFRLRKYLVAQ